MSDPEVIAMTNRAPVGYRWGDAEPETIGRPTPRAGVMLP